MCGALKWAGLVTPCKLAIVGHETTSLDSILDFWRAKDDSYAQFAIFPGMVSAPDSAGPSTS